jgi:hypothetical protein
MQIGATNSTSNYTKQDGPNTAMRTRNITDANILPGGSES